MLYRAATAIFVLLKNKLSTKNVDNLLYDSICWNKSKIIKVIVKIPNKKPKIFIIFTGKISFLFIISFFILLNPLNDIFGWELYKDIEPLRFKLWFLSILSALLDSSFFISLCLFLSLLFLLFFVIALFSTLFVLLVISFIAFFPLFNNFITFLLSFDFFDKLFFKSKLLFVFSALVSIISFGILYGSISFNVIALLFT